MEFNIDKTTIDELIFFVIKKNKNEIVVIVHNIDPIEPEIVLLGLILVNFGPLKIFPNTYPPMSVATQIIVIVNIHSYSPDISFLSL